MLISGWSSDVCASVLRRVRQDADDGAGGGGDARRGDQRLGELDGVDGMGHAAPLLLRGAPCRGFASRALYAKQRKNKLTRTAMPKLDLDTIPQTNTTEIGRAHV